MKNSVSIVLIGAGGMGSCYLNALFKDFSSLNIRICGVVEPKLDKSAYYEELADRNIPIYPSLNDFYEKALSADLVIISSPVQYHVAQSCLALKQGSYVLCEKPLAATVQEGRRLISEARSTKQWVKIGYQWSFSDTIQTLKKDIIQNRFGKPLRLKSLCFWPRDLVYYERNDWAGKKIDREGRWVLDSPANNAMAHFLHNNFYILGERLEWSALPREVVAELYRAYPIENYDTVACRAWTVEGTEILFYASHSTFNERGPLFSFEFERGTVSFGEGRNTVVASMDDGEEIDYGSPDKDPFRKLCDALAAVHTTLPVTCGPEGSFAQTMCMNGIQESMPNISSLPDSMVRKDKSRIWVDGLAEGLYACYKKGILPSESGFSWACPGQNIDLRKYEFFPGGTCPEEHKG